MNPRIRRFAARARAATGILDSPHASAPVALACMLLSLAAHGASADSVPGLFKCRGAGNVPLYQDAPCPPGTELRDLTADPPNFSVVPFESSPRAAPAPGPASRPSRTQKPAAREKAGASGRGVADPAERRHLREGMSEGEVLARLGVPDIQSGRGGRRARWTYLPVAGDAQTITVVRFEDGKVAGVERSLLR